MIAALCASVGAIYFRAQRWRILLRPVADVPLGPAFSTTAIGFAATSVLPLRLGELIRPALLARRVGFGVSAAVSSVVLERMFDMLFVILFFLVLSMVYTLPPDLRRTALLLGAGALVGLCMLLLVRLNRARAERVLETVLGWGPAAVGRAIRPLAAGFFDALGALESLAIVARVAGYSALLWSANALPYLFALLALDIHAPLIPAALASIVIVAAFVFIPQGPVEQWDHSVFANWVRDRRLWSDPGRLVPKNANGVLVCFNGWLYIAVEPSFRDAVLARIEELAAEWNLAVIRGAKDWAWFI